MITPWEIFWILKLGVISGLFIIPGIILSIGTLSVILWYCLEEEGENNYTDIGKWKRKVISMLVVGFLLIGIGLFIPSTKEMVTIIVAPKVLNNEDIQDIPTNFAKLVNEKMKELIGTVE